MQYVDKLDINGLETRLTTCIELHGRPNAATKGAVGVMGVDVDSAEHDIYVCVAVNGSIHTWVRWSGGGSGGGSGDVQTLEEMLQGFDSDPGSVKKYVDELVYGVIESLTDVSEVAL